MQRPATLGLLVVALGTLSPEASSQHLAGWMRFDNESFIAYSNAPRKEALEVLEELEYIRAAALQTPSFFIPEAGPRTLVILPATRHEFARYAPYATMAGFAQQLDGGAAIVMPASSPDTDARATVRHEFAHTMLFNDWFRYPPWYAEGFAEIVSAIAINKRRNTFTIGEMPDRYGRRFRPVIQWNDVIENEFNAHGLADRHLIQGAYAQHWLLVHHLTLSGKTEYAQRLNGYFSMVTSGRSSADAFLQAFGMTPDEFWTSELRSYARKVPVTSQDFDRHVLNTEFSISTARENELQPMLRYFTDKADARRNGETNSQPISSLPGMWDQLKIEQQCSEPLTFELRADSNIVVIGGFYSADDEFPVPALFAYEQSEDGGFRLTNITASEYPNVTVTSDYRLTIRGDNVLCFDRQPLGRVCASIFQRCNRRH